MIIRISLIIFSWSYNKNFNGLYQEWNENSNKLIECTILNLKHIGLYQKWYFDGKKEIECTFVDGERHGWCYVWNKDGSIKEVTFFRDDKEIDFRILAKERLDNYKEELVAKVFHPDRLERFAKLYSMDVMDYMDCLE